MTECYNVNALNILKMCRVCLGRKDVVRFMSLGEINCYQTLTTRVTNQEQKMYICSICGYLLRKFMRFSQQCRSADIIFSQLIKDSTSLPPTPLTYSHNFTTHPPKLYYVAPQTSLDPDLCDLKNDDYLLNSEHNSFTDDDDELPLTVFKGDDKLSNEIKLIDKDRKRKKCFNLTNENETNTTEIKSETIVAPEVNFQETCKPSRYKRKKVLREGFTSRMVQETNEYVVIKLTKEQVLEEMQEKLRSEKYKRALYKCERCAKGFNFEDVLQNHEERHSKKNGEFQCGLCTQYCPSAVSLRGHMKSHTTRYRCKVCGDVRLSRQHLLEHHAISHTAAPAQYSCDHCLFTTNKRTVIQRHVRTHKPSEGLACHECGRLFQNMESLRVHTTRHDKSKSVSCAQCARRFVYPSLLQRHERAVHARAEYYCVECDVTFKSPENLRLHFKKAKKHRDSSAYTHECPQCTEKFISAPSLSVHLSTAHGQPKEHACELCRRLYSSRESLKGHVRRVHGGKPPVTHGCHVCKKSFSRKSVLAAHLQAHAAAPPARTPPPTTRSHDCPA